MKENDNDNIIRADPGYRRKTLLAVLLVGAAACGFLVYFQSVLGEIGDLAAQSPELAVKKVMVLLQVVMALFALGSATFGIYFFIVSRRTLKAERFPPPGARVARDTRVVLGKPARARAIIGMSVALCFILLGIVTPLYAYKVMVTLLTAAAP